MNNHVPLSFAPHVANDISLFIICENWFGYAELKHLRCLLLYHEGLQKPELMLSAEVCTKRQVFMSGFSTGAFSDVHFQVPFSGVVRSNTF